MKDIMVSRPEKTAIVSFKADESLIEALRQVPNRSAFIRTAVLAALENLCPLCAGTGILTADQQKHWEAFSQDHALSECSDCHEWRLVCAHDQSEHVHVG